MNLKPCLIAIGLTVLASAGASAANRHAAAGDGIVAHYDFQEGSGDVLHDGSGRENHGAIHGAEWIQRGGRTGLRFEGADDLLDCGTRPDLDLTERLTLEAWVVVEEVPAREVLIAGKDPNSYALTFHKDGKCRFYSVGGGSPLSARVLLHKWQHVVGTFDGARMTLYVNGESQGTREVAQRINKGGGFLIGAAATGFKGIIGGVKVYSRTLSEEEVKMDYRLWGRRASKVSAWRIVTGETAHIVERTAAQELALFFEDILDERAPVLSEEASERAGKRIVLGTVSSSAAIRAAKEQGLLRELNVKGTKDDAYEVVAEADTILIAGQNPRGVLYGVFALDEYTRRNGNRLPEPGWRLYRKPAFRQRVTISYNSLAHVFNEEDVRYLARIGYNRMEVTSWGLPLGRWGLAALTDSDVFPSVKEPKTIQAIRGFLQVAHRYGVEGMFYMLEPQSIISLYGKDVVDRLGGKALLGRNRGLETTCVNSPVIQAHYQSLMRNVARDFPEISRLIVYENDGSFWLCHPDQCERCRASRFRVIRTFRGTRDP